MAPFITAPHKPFQRCHELPHLCAKRHKGVVAVKGLGSAASVVRGLVGEVGVQRCQSEAFARPPKSRQNTYANVHTDKGDSMATVISRVFVNGNSQAVRIPQEFRLNVNRVQISRNEVGDLVIRPLPLNRGAALLDALQGFDTSWADDFLNRVNEDRQAQAPVQEREPL
jgi:antitoxin VapB